METGFDYSKCKVGAGPRGFPSLGSLIVSDLRAKAEWLYGSVSSKNIAKTLVTDGTFAMLVYRLMQFCQRRRLSALAMIFNKLNTTLGSCIIGRGANFGPGFVLIHSIGVVINGAVRGGRNVKIEHLVTIGAERNVSPALGDDVFIGAGAKIIGSVKIGSGVKIGANAVVVTDLPDGVTAVGIPAKIVRRQEIANTTNEGIPEYRAE
jgi:serine O-acetyltransferase